MIDVVKIDAYKCYCGKLHLDPGAAHNHDRECRPKSFTERLEHVANKMMDHMSENVGGCRICLRNLEETEAHFGPEF